MLLLYSKTFRLSLISFWLKPPLNTALLQARLLAIAHVWSRSSMCWASKNCLRNSNLTIYGIFPVFLPLSNTFCLVFTTTAWFASGAFPLFRRVCTAFSVSHIASFSTRWNLTMKPIYEWVFVRIHSSVCFFLKLM